MISVNEGRSNDTAELVGVLVGGIFGGILLTGILTYLVNWFFAKRKESVSLPKSSSGDIAMSITNPIKLHSTV